jgi:hypothetical protein
VRNRRTIMRDPRKTRRDRAVPFFALSRLAEAC